MNPGREGKLTRTAILFTLAVCMMFLVSAPTGFAQTTGSATLRGSVKDQTGALIPAATVTLINERTRDERRTVTNNEGVYNFSALAPGSYTLKVEARDFKTLEQSGLAIETSSARALDVVMEVGQPAETVTITTAGDQLQTETGAKDHTITAQQIDNLSIISRSSLELLRILPGVVAPDTADLESISFGGGANANANYSVNGLRGVNNNISIDGARMLDIGSNNGTIITANPDMVQEVRVQTSNYAAEHGTSAVQISATTKGGGRDFHGSLYDYIRHHRFQANDRSNTTASPQISRPESKYNYPGGNFSGPVLLPGTKFNRNRDKLFFFVGYEYYYQRVDEGSSFNRVPTLRQRQGDFSELPAGSVLVPNGCTVNGVGPGNPAPNNNLAPCAHPFGRALLNLYPAPNLQNNPNFNYVYSVLRPNDRNQFTTRFDYTVSEKTKLYVKFAREYEEQGFPRGLWWNSSSYELPGNLRSSNLGRSFVVHLTNILNPTMTNEVLFSASKLKLNYDYADPDKVSYEGLGLDRVGFFPSTNPYLPVGVIDEWAGRDLLTAYGYPILAWNDSFAITDNLTKVHNTHTLKFGAFIEQANKRQQSNNDTYITLAQWGQNFTGNNYGDLFVGRPIEFQQATQRPIDNFRYYNYEFYAQDSWKVRPNFTLEYGLRVAYLPNNFERKGLGVLFDPAAYDPNQGIFINGDRTRPNGFKLAARGEIPKGILDNPGLSFMPRLNFAWDIGGKGDLVIRAGAGVFYNRVQGNYDYYSSGQMPNMYSAIVDTPWASATGLTFDDLTNVDPFSLIGANIDIASRDVNSNDLPRVANMSLTVEKRLPGNNILTVAYVSTQGRHLPQQRNLNVIPLGRLLNGTVNGIDLTVPVNRAGLDGSLLNQFRPFQRYRFIGLYQFTGTSTYHSLQATLSRQWGKNFQYFATYTFSKALGTVAVNESDGDAWADPVDTRNRSWGVLPFDRTHIFNLSYNYNLPKMARGSFSNFFTRGLLNGWQISGITTFQSGIPIRLRFTGDIASTAQTLAWYGSDAWASRAGASLGAVTPLYTGNPSLGGKALGDRIFDLTQLQIPSFPNTGPSQPPFYLRTPSRSNFDISFFKNFQISESKKFQFRTGFFNIFNQAYPTQFNTNGALGTSDIYLTLNTVCNARVNVPNGIGGMSNPCDPTQGFTYTQETRDNFGRIVNKRGRRIVEFAFKFYF